MEKRWLALEQARRASDVVGRLRRLVERPDLAGQAQPLQLPAAVHDALHLLDPWPRHADETPSFAAIAHGLTQVIATQRALVQLATHSSSTATP